jgi:ABC-2 type transport system ATP-binding protein
MSQPNQPTRMIEAVGLTKVFRDFWHRPKARAVNDLDFVIHAGEVLGLLGPNGSGKSTTIKMILGLLYPTAGTIRVFGQSPRDVKNKHRIGYLPEESFLYKYLTALETLDFFGALFDLPGAERRKRSEQLLDMVGLSHARHRPVGEFSKGMVRRIGLAQAMINDPDLLILDEPTSGLDPLGCKEVKDVIRLLQQRGKTVIVCSHLLSDVEDVCDRAIILYGGRIRAQGSLKELLVVPDASRFTTPLLPPAVTEKVLAVLREHLHGEEIRVDRPQRSLEEFFLEVVANARAESVETAGVQSGGEIAAYLRQGQAPASQILSTLAAPQAVVPPQAPQEEPPALARPASERLAELTTASTPTPVAPVPADVPAAEDANLRLRHLLPGADPHPGPGPGDEAQGNPR